MRWLLVVGLHGLRKGEANHLRPEDINIEGSNLDIRIHCDIKGKVIWKPKFGIDRKVPFVEATVPLMNAASLTLGDVQKIFGHKVKGMDRVYDQRTVERLHKVMHVMPLVPNVSHLLTSDAALIPGDPRPDFVNCDRLATKVESHRFHDGFLGRGEKIRPRLAGVQSDWTEAWREDGAKRSQLPTP